MAKKMLEQVRIEDPFNWNGLPTEIKTKIVKNLSLETKMSLRCTAHTEKAIVDSQKIHIPFLRIATTEPFRFAVQITKGNDVGDSEFYTFESRPHEKLSPFLGYLVNSATFGLFSVVLSRVTKLQNLLKFGKSIDTRRIRVEAPHLREVSFLLKKCEADRLQEISIRGMRDRQCSEKYWSRILILPVVINARRSYFCGYDLTIHIVRLLKEWIDRDAEVGTQFQFGFTRRNFVLMELIARQASDNHGSASDFKIPMNDPTKKIHVVVSDSCTATVVSVENNH